MREHQIAAELIKWRDHNLVRFPFLCLLYHIPNEGKRAIYRAKREGILSGVPDYCLPVPAPKHGFGGFYIELKVKDKKPSKNQRKVMLQLELMGGHKVTWADNIGEAIAKLEAYCGMVVEK